MYLIAACLPSLRILVVRLRDVISTSLSSLLERHHVSDNVADGPQRATSGESQKELVGPHIFRRLTTDERVKSPTEAGEEIELGHVRSKC